MINPRNLLTSHSRHSSRLDDLLDDDPFGCSVDFPSPPPRDDGPLRRQLSRGIRQSLQVNTPPSLTYSSSEASESRSASPTGSAFSLTESTYSLNDHRDYRPMTPPRLSSLDYNARPQKQQKQLLSPVKLKTETRRPQSPTKQKFASVSRSLLTFISMF